MPEHLQRSASPGFRSNVWHAAGSSGSAVQHARARKMPGDESESSPPKSAPVIRKRLPGIQGMDFRQQGKKVKKVCFVILSATCAMNVAHAQSSVTLYGIIDEAIRF